MIFKRPFIRVLCLALLFITGISCLRAAEWQWSVPVASDIITADQQREPARAFLWIPPDCARVRGVVVAQNNMLEEGILEHPEFRRTLSELGLAEIWITPRLDLVFDFTRDAGTRFDAMMSALARESGYGELAFAPIVPIGHSAAASYPWNFAAWNPSRTLAVLSIKGDAPRTHLTGSGRPNPDWGSRVIDGIPGLQVMGEYEWSDARMIPAAVFRGQHSATPITVLCDAGRGHFDSSDALARYLTLFLRKTVEHRLPADAPLDAPVALNPVDPRAGWLINSGRKGGPPRAPAAPFSRYTGDKREAFWVFDEEMARATELHTSSQSGKKPQLLGFAHDAVTLAQDPKSHAQIALTLPPLDDSLTFKLSGVFLDTVPPGNPEKWSGLPAGSPIDHARHGGPVTLSRICGPVVQTAPGEFALQFNRLGFADARRSSEIWLLASHPGSEHFTSAVQQASLRFPLRNTAGQPQTLTFPAPADQPLGTTQLKLTATSDSGAPVHYYVREGPAEIDGDVLRFTAVPPRTKFPVRITVVAWQWGRTAEPRLQSAAPIERSFQLVKPATP